MRARWLTLALVFSSGCFGAHGPEGEVDAGPPSADAGPPMCELYGASILFLECPATVIAGEPASVTISTSPAACCGSGTIRPTYRNEGGVHRISIEWDACECCETCRCVGPIDDVVVQTDPLDEGVHTVDVDGTTCTVEAIALADCRSPTSSTNFRAPLHLLEGQSYPTTLTSEPSASCACNPVVVGADTLGYSLQLCGCCDLCDCIDPGYQASYVRDALPVGDHAVGIPHGESQVTVHPRAECYEIDPTGLTIEPPRTDLVQGGPALFWARITGEEWTCCAVPTPVVERLDTTDGSIALTLMSCVTIDCDCEPTGPTGTSTWFSLGELRSGTHRIRLGGLSETVIVP